MTENTARVNDFDKGSITLELPGSLHEAVLQIFGYCLAKMVGVTDNGPKGHSLLP